MVQGERKAYIENDQIQCHGAINQWKCKIVEYIERQLQGELKGVN